MIICVCKNINSEAIETAVAQGANTVDRVRKATGAAMGCGKCKFKINRIVQDKSLEVQLQQQQLQSYNSSLKSSL